MPKLKRKESPQRSTASRVEAKFILAMHQPDGTLFLQKYPQSWGTEKQALEAAKQKHSRYSKPFSVLKLIATTKVDPADIQLELFK